MLILSHRGYWKTASERNGEVAFLRSFAFGFGTETDVRDCRGTLVISHDMPTGSEMTLDAMLALVGNRRLPLAFNVKADGIGSFLAARMDQVRYVDWFTFDMSVPDLVEQLRLNLPAFTRASEFERSPPLYTEAQGIWLDAFRSEWYTKNDIVAFLGDGKRVCIVSPELHQRPHHALWEMLRATGVADHPALMICTDMPEEARIYFREAR